MPEKKQHVDIQRKLKLRTQLLERAGDLPGAYYIPFIGEGDIAAALYMDKNIYGADIDGAMVRTAQAKLPGAYIVAADCDQFPFHKDTATFSLADFNAYSYPYDSFRSFFETAKISSQCVLIFTDGQRQAIIRSGTYRSPSGEKIKLAKTADKRAAFNFYFNQTVQPWFKDYIKPWHIVYVTKYLRAGSMCYWGAIIVAPGVKYNNNNKNASQSHQGDGVDITVEKPSLKNPYKLNAVKKEEYLEKLRNGHTRGYAATLVGVGRTTIYDHMKADKRFADAISEAEGDAIAKVENALYEAATSGNTTAIQVFLYNRDPKRWSDRRNIQLAGVDGGPIKVDIDAKGKLTSILARLASRTRETGSDKQPESEGS